MEECKRNEQSFTQLYSIHIPQVYIERAKFWLVTSAGIQCVNLVWCSQDPPFSLEIYRGYSGEVVRETYIDV